MRKLIIPLLAALAAAALTAGIAVGSNHDDGDGRGGDTYAIGLWGDMPYNDVQATTGVPNLIADMNKQDLAFTAHDGDLKAGSGPCTDDIYTRALGYLNSLRAPAAFTPGDNDWTDCDRNPGVNSLERLDHERALFFNTPFMQGRHRLRQEVQVTPQCKGFTKPSVPCVENRRWTVGRVTYVTLNVQGSCNNLCDIAPDPEEFAARNAADIAWLNETFDQAAKRRSAAIMIISQADPGWDLSDSTRAPLRDPKSLTQTDGQPDGFATFLNALRDDTIAFKKPVVYVNGDSHYFRIDKPLLNPAGQRLENFTRVETFGDHQENGDNDVHWLKVTVDPSSREVFSYQPQIVPGNRIAVPSQ
jgi:hypothetical protein